MVKVKDISPWTWIIKHWEMLTILMFIVGTSINYGGQKMAKQLGDKEFKRNFDSLVVNVQSIRVNQDSTIKRMDRLFKAQVNLQSSLERNEQADKALQDSYMKFILTGQKDILELIHNMTSGVKKSEQQTTTTTTTTTTTISPPAMDIHIEKIKPQNITN